MNRISPHQAQAEAADSLADLAQQVGPVPPVFAYPSGGFDPGAVEALRAAGIELAFTTGRGINNLRTADPLLLRRINIGRHTSPALLRAQLLPWVRYLAR
jgi:hypothetical protein